MIFESRSKTAKFWSATTFLGGQRPEFLGPWPNFWGIDPYFWGNAPEIWGNGPDLGALTPDLGTFVVRGTKLGRFLSGLGIESIFQSKMKGKGMEKTQSLGIGPPSKGTTF